MMIDYCWRRSAIFRHIKLSIKRKFISILAVFLVVMIVLIQQVKQRKNSFVETVQKDAYRELQRRLQILAAQEKGTRCKMPDLSPFAPEVAVFDEHHENLVCKGEDWVECRLSACFLKKTILNRLTDVSCTYRDLIYVDDENYHLGDPVKVDGDAKYELSESDHVKVSCKGIVPGSLGLIASRWTGLKAGYRSVNLAGDFSTTSFSIFIIMIDSMSKNEFVRLMPTTYNVLVHDMGAVVMDAFNIVGSGTGGTILPILTGHNDLELPDFRKSSRNSKRLDPKYLILSLLEDHGYRTAYYEDMPNVNVFNFRYNGFERRPAHHYMRPLLQEANKMFNLILNKINQCFGTEILFKFMLDYAAQLFNLSGKKFCLVLSGTHSHDPQFIYIPQLDDKIADYLSTFKYHGHLDDTLLFVMGDHGQRFTSARNTYQGKIEERLPFLSVVLPERLRIQRPEAHNNLVANSEMLTTPYDIHTTMLDVLGLKQYRNKYMVPGSDIERGISFLEPIPQSRSCAEAGVTPHWCACKNWYNVSRNDSLYTRVVWELTDYVNAVVEHKRKLCATKYLRSVVWVHYNVVKTEIGHETGLPLIEYIGLYAQTRYATSNFLYYQAKIIMDPGEAIYEGTMFYNKESDTFSISDGDVSRIDPYGNEPWCISGTDPYLIPYCYCM